MQPDGSAGVRGPDRRRRPGAHPQRAHQEHHGVELQFGSNVLGPFALTLRLLPLLLAAPAPRVATMSGVAAWQGRVRFDDLQGERRYRAWGRTRSPSWPT